MFKKFKLAEFENHIPKDILEKGKEYIEEGHQYDYQENNDLITGIFHHLNNQQIEAFIYKTKSFILGFDCNCREFDGQFGCKHITALLIHKRDARSSLKPTKPNLRINLEKIFQISSFEEIKSFLSHYAQIYPAFNRFAKEYFTYKFLSSDDQFKGYLNQLFSKYTSTDGKIKKASLNILVNTIEIHILRTRKILDENDIISAQTVLFILLDKYLPLYNIYGEQIPKNTIIFNAEFLVANICNKEISPSLTEDIGNKILSYYSSKLYTAIHDKSFGRSLIYLKDNKYHLDMLIHLLQDDPFYQQLEQTPLFIFEILHLTNSFDFNNFFIQYATDEKLFFNLINIANQNRFYNDDLVKMILIANDKSYIGTDLLILSSEYLINNSKFEEASKLITVYLNQSQDNNVISIINPIKNFLQNKTINQKLQKNFSSKNSKKQFNASFILFSGNQDEINTYFTEHADLPLIAEYIEKIIDIDEDHLINILTFNILQFLNQYFGPKANDYIASIFDEIMFAKKGKILKFISKAILEQYPDRNNLQSLLNSYKIH